MRWLGIVGLCSGCVAGCSSTNISELVKAHAANPRAYCAIINAGPYGGGTVAAGSPDVSVRVSASGCEIIGSHVTTVTVPTNSVTVTPPPTAPVAAPEPPK
jgi:hypothetical protein